MNAKETSAFGRLLRDYRAAAGMSQERLAEQTGLSSHGISDLERGARTTPRLETVRLLAIGLGLDGSDTAALIAARGPARNEEIPALEVNLPMLPVPSTPLVGRARESGVVVDFLCGEGVRFVTLTGPGGVGKTRPALAVGHCLTARFTGGTVFVDLSPIQDPALVLPTIATALGMRDTGGNGPVQMLATALRDRHLLLILDNCEQVVDAAPDIATLMAACPGIRVLATSRVLLRLAAEQVFQVPSLQLPDTGVIPLPADLAQSEAVALFVARARAADPDFALTEANAETVASLVCRLDGLPLAIELAAARTSVLPPKTLLARLQHRLDVLTDGPRDVPARRRDMRNAIGWSHDLLNEEHQALFQRLGVFVGGFTLDAAEAAADDDVLAGLSTLVAASLVNRIESVVEEPRFVMLETIREYALEHLSASGHEAVARERHARYYLSLAERTDYCWFMSLPEGVNALTQLNTDEANVRAALLWFQQKRDYTSIMRMAGRLGALWVVSGHTQEGQRWLEQALEHGSNAPGTVRARALATLSWTMNTRGQNRMAFELAEEGLLISRSWDEPLITTYCLVLSAVPGYSLRKYDHAIARFEEATAILSSLDEPPWTRNMLITITAQMGMVSFMQGHIAKAEAYYRSALEQELLYGCAPGQSHIYGHSVLAGFGDVARAKGDPATAFGHYKECLIFGGCYHNVRAILSALGGMAGSLAALDHHSTAARLFGACEALHAFFGFRFHS